MDVYFIILQYKENRKQIVKVKNMVEKTAVEAGFFQKATC
jgi:hypothetical protein